MRDFLGIITLSLRISALGKKNRFENEGQGEKEKKTTLRIKPREEKEEKKTQW